MATGQVGDCGAKGGDGLRGMVEGGERVYWGRHSAVHAEERAGLLVWGGRKEREGS